LTNGIPVQNNRYGVGIPEVDCFVDCVGFTEASGHGATQERKPAVVLNRHGNYLSWWVYPNSGLYVTEDPGATDEASKQGNLKTVLIRLEKSHSFHRTNTSNEISRQLMNAILNDKINIAKLQMQSSKLKGKELC
jgi:glutathione-independent formaldehyde dehydrogenase